MTIQNTILASSASLIFFCRSEKLHKQGIESVFYFFMMSRVRFLCTNLYA